MSAMKDKVIDELNEEQARLGQGPKGDREQRMIDCIVNLTAAVEAIRKSVVILANKITALELHAKHQDQVRH